MNADDILNALDSWPCAIPVTAIDAIEWVLAGERGAAHKIADRFGISEGLAREIKRLAKANRPTLTSSKGLAGTARLKRG